MSSPSQTCLQTLSGSSSPCSPSAMWAASPRLQMLPAPASLLGLLLLKSKVRPVAPAPAQVSTPPCWPGSLRADGAGLGVRPDEAPTLSSWASLPSTLVFLGPLLLGPWPPSWKGRRGWPVAPERGWEPLNGVCRCLYFLFSSERAEKQGADQVSSASISHVDHTHVFPCMSRGHMLSSTAPLSRDSGDGWGQWPAWTWGWWEGKPLRPGSVLEASPLLLLPSPSHPFSCPCLTSPVFSLGLRPASPGAGYACWSPSGAPSTSCFCSCPWCKVKAARHSGAR